MWWLFCKRIRGEEEEDYLSYVRIGGLIASALATADTATTSARPLLEDLRLLPLLGMIIAGPRPAALQGRIKDMNELVQDKIISGVAFAFPISANLLVSSPANQWTPRVIKGNFNWPSPGGCRPCHLLLCYALI